MLNISRLGVSAPGDGFPGYLYVSTAQLEAVPRAHTYQLGSGVGLPMAHLQDNDWGGKCSVEIPGESEVNFWLGSGLGSSYG